MAFPDRPVLMAIVGPGGARSAGHAIRGGADLVQVRAKELSARELVKLVRAVIAEVGAADKIIVNSRPEIAELAGASRADVVELERAGVDAVIVSGSDIGSLVGDTLPDH